MGKEDQIKTLLTQLKTQGVKDIEIIPPSEYVYENQIVLLKVKNIKHNFEIRCNYVFSSEPIYINQTIINNETDNEVIYQVATKYVTYDSLNDPNPIKIREVLEIIFLILALSLSGSI